MCNSGGWNHCIFLAKQLAKWEGADGYCPKPFQAGIEEAKKDQGRAHKPELDEGTMAHDNC